MLRDIRIIAPLGHGLDEQTVDAARQFRFKPRMRNRQTIPIHITMEVHLGFRSIQ
jgi:hypothetical protein